jgi:uncharacterized damage-inducible protein DinB
MLEPEKQELLRALKEGQDALRASLDGVDDALAKRKPASGGWSILECVEHVAVAERFLLSRLTGASRCEQPPENQAREKHIAARAADRSRPIESPEVGRPAGRFDSLGEALGDFDRARAETVRFVEEFADELRFRLTDHPLIPGPVNCMEILLLVTAHPVRHAKQVAEIRASLAAADAEG